MKLLVSDPSSTYSYESLNFQSYFTSKLWHQTAAKELKRGKKYWFQELLLCGGKHQLIGDRIKITFNFNTLQFIFHTVITFPLKYKEQKNNLQRWFYKASSISRSVSSFISLKQINQTMHHFRFTPLCPLQRADIQIWASLWISPESRHRTVMVSFLSSKKKLYWRVVILYLTAFVSLKHTSCHSPPLGFCGLSELRVSRVPLLTPSVMTGLLTTPTACNSSDMEMAQF